VAVPVFPVSEAARVAFAGFGTHNVTSNVDAQYPGLRKTVWLRPGDIEILSLLE
jgi:hypothetical protein